MLLSSNFWKENLSWVTQGQTILSLQVAQCFFWSNSGAMTSTPAIAACKFPPFPEDDPKHDLSTADLELIFKQLEEQESHGLDPPEKVNTMSTVAKNDMHAPGLLL